MAGLLDEQISNFTTDGRIYSYRIVFLFNDNLCVYPAERIDFINVEPQINSSNFLSIFEHNKTS